MKNNTPNIIIVSGRSGSGKTSVLNILEDFGYYCLDNLPLSLVMIALEKLTQNDIKKIALGIDVRTPHADLSNFGDIYDKLIALYGHHCVQVIYTTANENVLVARFGATRRVHPLMAMGIAGNLPSAIDKEVEILQAVDESADIKIDTSLLNTHELKQKISELLGIDGIVSVNILSFGFKYGVPIDADFVFDVRILPNPHWQPNLRAKTGLDDEVVAFFGAYPEVDEMADDLGAFFVKWLPNFLHNNRHTITLAIGCTGGKHRSVYIANRLSGILNDKLPAQMTVTVKHREKRFWQTKD